MQLSDRDIYLTCKDRGYFELDGNQKIQQKDKNFCIMMPPPNVTGVLHIGHALTFTLQDIITRYKRMQGYRTLYQPGLDHAGIATQNIVEKQLLSQGIVKEDLGREEFIKKVWEWKEESGGKIIEQMYSLGITPAWSRARFTMDKGLANAVREAFVTWYEKGLIIQGDYMVNWCAHDGALSDIEVEYEENQGKLYYLRYPIKDSTDSLIVATTRPETFFGDTAVMVNPKDSRYTHLIGKKIILPLVGREIPIISDECVDSEFGSGCVKVTPAHDVNDYEVGKRHQLESIVVFDAKGFLNTQAGKFMGKERLEAREDIVQALQREGFIDHIEDYVNQIGKCYRCGNVVEPYISKQWFVKKEIAQTSMQKVQEDLMHFYPKEWKNNYNAWMRELRDWCISRQLWWGHRIPVWYCEDCAGVFASREEMPKACKHCQSTKIFQDPDVLDTWFSSGLWAFSTLGWGNRGAEKEKYQEEDLQDFYPNSLLITGFDILFFWVARMVLSGESLLEELPFRDVYLHALVRDEFGNKMSKSKGNVIDPLSMIEAYGADNLRFSLALLCAQGRDIKLSLKKLKDTQAFLIKLENAVKFLELYAKQQEPNFTHFQDRENLGDYHTNLGRYLKSQFNATSKKVQEELENYRFNDAAMSLYSFLWMEFCDWGIELAKVEKSAVFELGSIFKDAMKLLHPFMPFVTEKIWHRLNHSDLRDCDSIMISRYPSDFEENAEMLSEFAVIKDCIISARRVKTLLDLGDRNIEKIFLVVHQPVADSERLKQFVSKCAKAQTVEILDAKIPNAVADIGDYCQSLICLEGIDLSAIKKRLYSQQEKLNKEVMKLEGLLDNTNFIKNAPKEVLENHQEGLRLAREKLQKTQEELQKFSQNP
ncbi:valyl-tRNA synthetase [Helicobacter mustelae]|uniref:valine--tRNA ligase n=1 Tax=Helicobacter mustelae TaxID=217 RepID=UPI000E00CF4F|nr:valine--tRNA ligase [Helicobacter mustelae]STP12094.1 valyl-tRNA synthetase [Helicobacter mustelae]